MKNIHYKTNELSDFYSEHRICWNDFYPSEKWIFEKVAGDGSQIRHVLDVGCAVGGLGNALNERFGLSEYFGIDINGKCIEIARNRINSIFGFNGRFECGDILEIEYLPEESYDAVFSLSCADWNVRTQDIVSECWRYVKKDKGHLIITLRLTPEKSSKLIEESYQYITFKENISGVENNIEKAPYVVFNVKEAFSMLMSLSPKPVRIIAYGYWGEPSRSARTPYDRLVFLCVCIAKDNR